MFFFNKPSIFFPNSVVNSVLTSLDSPSLEYNTLIGSAAAAAEAAAAAAAAAFLLVWMLAEVSCFLLAGALRPRPLVPRLPTPLVSSSAARANRSLYSFYVAKWLKTQVKIKANSKKQKNDNTNFGAVVTVHKSLLQCSLHGVLHVEASAGAVAVSTTPPEMLQMAEQL